MSSFVFRHLHGFFTTTTTTTKITASAPKPPKATTTALNPSPLDSPNDQTLKTLIRKFKKASNSSSFLRINRKCYATIVHCLTVAQKFTYIEDILEHQKKYEDITSEGFTLCLISLCGKSSMFDHAHKVFEEMPQLKCERTVMSFNALLSTCVNSKKFDKIGKHLGELMENLSIKPDLISYNTVVKVFCEMGSFDFALSVIYDMDNNGLGPDLITFSTLLDAFYRNNRFSEAEKVWALMEDKNGVLNVRSYNPKLCALVADIRILEVVELIEEMGRRGVMPDVLSFNALIKGFCDDGNLEGATRWYSEIAKNDCNSNPVTFTMLGFCACDG